jgi:ATP-dependent protease ClpP protease subunit
MNKKENNGNKENILNNKYHTLIIEDVPEEKIDVKGKENTFKIIPGHKIYNMYIGELLEDEAGLHKIFHELYKAGKHDELVLRINSYGGYVSEGIVFYNITQNVFKGRVTTYIESTARSMGALLFCMGDKRVVHEFSELMFHDYSGGFYGKGEEVHSVVEHNSKYLRNFFKKLIVGKGFFTEKEFEELTKGVDYWLTTEDMCKRNLATHVMIDGEEITAKEYLTKYCKHSKRSKK